MNNFFFTNVILLIGIASFIILSNHYLVLLLGVEFIILSLLMLNRTQNQIFIKEIRLIFLFISIIIIEGIFGLVLLTASSQSYGKDYILLIN